MALWLGVLSASAAAFGPCCCYVPYFFSLPLGIGALVYGVKVLGVSTNPVTRSVATASVVGGAVGVTLPLLIGVFIVLYVALSMFAGVMGVIQQ